uniref:Uncharacterized protein n=1 Tax=Setaria digitata TaxID=48799 RepID=A0A915Q7P9_9BILA
MNDVRERLKDNDLSLFGNIDEILAKTPRDLEAHMNAVIKLNNSVDDKESLLKCLKYADSGILYVNDAFLDQYQNGLQNRQKILAKNEFLNREQIQSVVTAVNHAEALKQLESVLRDGKIPEVTEVNVILDHLQQDDILRGAGLLYAQELYKMRRAQNDPLTIEQVETLLKAIKMCLRVRFYALESDENCLCEALKCKSFGMEAIVKCELKGIYKNAIREKYDNVGKDYVLMVDELRDIIKQVNDEMMENRVCIIKDACKKGDKIALANALDGLEGIREDLMAHYLEELQEADFSSIANINDILKYTNEKMEQQESLFVQDMITACQRNDSRMLTKVLKNIREMREDLAPYYLEAIKRTLNITPNIVETIIQQINERIPEIRKKVHGIEWACQKGDIDNLRQMLTDVKGVKMENVRYYLEALKNGHYITVEEIEEIIATVNETITSEQEKFVCNVASICKQNDEAKLANVLGEMKNVRKDLMQQYLNALINVNYSTMDDIEMIIAKINQSVENNQRTMAMIALACQQNDCNSLLLALRSLANVNEEFIPYYMFAIKKGQSSTVEEVEQIIQKVNEDVNNAAARLQDTLRLNIFLADGKTKDAIKLLLSKSWKKFIRTNLKSDYVARLRQEIIARMNKLGMNLNARGNDDEYLRERFPDGLLYINVESEEIIHYEPNKTIEWMLTSEEIEDIVEMINDKEEMKQKNGADKEIVEKAARIIQHWWKKQQFSKNFDELIKSDKPSLQLIRRFVSLLLHTPNDKKEDAVLSDLFRTSVLPVYSYGMSNREMSLLALLLANYLAEEIKELNDPVEFRNTPSCIILQILMEFRFFLFFFLSNFQLNQRLYGKTEIQRLQIAGLNRKLNEIEHQVKYFNLNPISLFESITDKKPTNADQAMGNATVAKILSNSKKFLTYWATVYADVVLGRATEYPDIIRYIAISARSELKKRFPMRSETSLTQAINAWLFKGCWTKVIIATTGNVSEITENEIKNSALAIRETICKFIEYGILNFGVSV